MVTRPEHEESDRQPPLLASIPKVDPFVVPEGLFERFPHQVQARVTGRSSAPTWSPWVKRLALALPLTAALAGAWWMLRSTDATVEQVSVVIPETTVDELAQLDDPEALASLYVSEEASDANTDVDLTTDELAAWLDLERTDLSELITEL